MACRHLKDVLDFTTWINLYSCSILEHYHRCSKFLGTVWRCCFLSYTFWKIIFIRKQWTEILRHHATVSFIYFVFPLHVPLLFFFWLSGNRLASPMYVIEHIHVFRRILQRFSMERTAEIKLRECFSWKLGDYNFFFKQTSEVLRNLVLSRRWKK